MNIPIEKQGLIQLVLNSNSEAALKKVKAILKKQATLSETEYLLSTDANKEHLMSSIEQMKTGNTKTIKTVDLWK